MTTLGSDASPYVCGIFSTVGGLVMAGVGVAEPSALLMGGGAALVSLGLASIREGWMLEHLDVPRRVRRRARARVSTPAVGKAALQR